MKRLRSALAVWTTVFAGLSVTWASSAKSSSTPLEAPTPRIDQLASEGTRLLNFNVEALARVGGGEVPKDRVIDGVDQLDFLLGKQENSNREGFPAFVSNKLYAVKWRNWKMHLVWQVNMYDPPQTLEEPRIFNLLSDLKEERDVGAKASWVAVPMTKILTEWQESLEKYPPIKMGTPDPYVPPNSQ
jgi:hypothetical protein